jgi:hypothetical protein
MPYASKKQEAWAHTPAGEKALGGPAKVAEWDAASEGLKLPDRAPPRREKKAPAKRTKAKKPTRRIPAQRKPKRR